jgi:hypothetical protein
LTIDVNWKTYLPKEQEEILKDLEGLVKSGYHTMTAEQKKAGMLDLPMEGCFRRVEPMQPHVPVSLSNIEAQSKEADFQTWDAVLQKNEELQKADWKSMSLEDKKAGKPERNASRRSVNVPMHAHSKFVAYFLAWGPPVVTDWNFQLKVFGGVFSLVGLAVAWYYAYLSYRGKRSAVLAVVNCAISNIHALSFISPGNTHQSIEGMARSRPKEAD